jgi:hypothetical protein
MLCEILATPATLVLPEPTLLATMLSCVGSMVAVEHGLVKSTEAASCVPGMNVLSKRCCIKQNKVQSLPSGTLINVLYYSQTLARS